MYSTTCLLQTCMILFFWRTQILKIFCFGHHWLSVYGGKNSWNILQKYLLFASQKHDTWWVNDDTIPWKIKMISLRIFNILELLALCKQIWKQNQHQLLEWRQLSFSAFILQLFLQFYCIMLSSTQLPTAVNWWFHTQTVQTEGLHLH